MNELSSAQASAFHSFEHAGWEAVPAAYDDAFAGLTSQSIAPLLDAAGVRSGAQVLDVATGPGYVAHAAAARGAAVTGLDFSATMLDEARRRHPGLRFVEGDAQALPFPDASFDAVVMNYGLLHLPEPDLALREAARVLRHGGRVAFTVWAAPDRSLAFGWVLGAVQRLGDMSVPLPPGPPFFRFSDPAECEQALLNAGFAAPRVDGIEQHWLLRSPQQLFDHLLHGTVRTRALLEAQRADALQAIRADICSTAAAFGSGTGIDVPMASVLACAVRR